MLTGFSLQHWTLSITFTMKPWVLSKIDSHTAQRQSTYAIGLFNSPKSFLVLGTGKMGNGIRTLYTKPDIGICQLGPGWGCFLTYSMCTPGLTQINTCNTYLRNIFLTSYTKACGTLDRFQSVEYNLLMLTFYKRR